MQDRKLNGFAALIIMVLFALALLQSCQEELPAPGPPETAREWVEASARYHDPEARWQAFRASFHIKSIFPSGSSYANDLFLNRARDTFSRTIVIDGFPLVQVVGPSGCSASWPNPDASEQDLLRYGLKENPCDYILFRQKFYDFLMGIPMVALEEGDGAVGSGPVDFRQNPNLVDAFGVDCVEIEMTFAPEEPTWFLYIEPTSYRLQAAKFIQSNGFGEWISYEADEPFDGFLLKKTQRWYYLDGEEVIKDEIEWKL